MNNEHTPFDSYRVQLRPGDKIQFPKTQCWRCRCSSCVRVYEFQKMALCFVIGWVIGTVLFHAFS